MAKPTTSSSKYPSAYWSPQSTAQVASISSALLPILDRLLTTIPLLVYPGVVLWEFRKAVVATLPMPHLSLADRRDSVKRRFHDELVARAKEYKDKLIRMWNKYRYVDTAILMPLLEPAELHALSYVVYADCGIFGPLLLPLNNFVQHYGCDVHELVATRYGLQKDDLPTDRTNELEVLRVLERKKEEKEKLKAKKERREGEFDAEQVDMILNLGGIDDEDRVVLDGGEGEEDELVDAIDWDGMGEERPSMKET